MLKCPHCRKDLPLSLFAAYLGRRAKGKTSPAKARASRENGKKGGRPRKARDKD
jgi:hypothetical protein